MSKKKKSGKSHKKKIDIKGVDVYHINQEIMPVVNDIKRKMDDLQNKYNFSLDFSFPELTMDEILNFKDQ